MIKILLVSFLLLITACSNPLGGADSVVDQGHHPGQTPQIPAANSAGLNTSMISSAQYEKTTIRSYKVSHNLGELSSHLNSVTPRGYKFYSNIQGTMISEEP